jgi:GTP cyclohydrolase I
MSKKMKDYIKKRYMLEFYQVAFDNSEELSDNIENEFAVNYQLYLNLPTFKANENIHEVMSLDNNYIRADINDRVHFIMRMATEYYLSKALEAMKVDLNDPNIHEDRYDGNIGTAGRIAKVWCGKDMSDISELGSGRWNRKPRIAAFPNTDIDSSIPITKKVDLISNCSHHFISFNSLSKESSYAIISYIPEDQVIGISKLQRLTDYIAKRFWLQEDLARMLYEGMVEITNTKSVYVGLFDIVHGCEMLRGPRSNDGSFTTECYGGKFKKKSLRNSVLGR